MNNNQPINELDALMYKYRADKGSWFHSYCGTYNAYLGNRRENIKKVLEIGTAQGNSLSAWRDFFPNAQIYGIDNQDIPQLDPNNERITRLIGSQNDVKFLETLKEFGPFDLIIDDGSHESHDMVISLDYCFPNLLASNGIYIIEDLVGCGKIFSNGSLIQKSSENIVECLSKLIKEMNWWNEGYHCADIEKLNFKPNNHWQINLQFIHLYRGLAILCKR